MVEYFITREAKDPIELTDIVGSIKIIDEGVRELLENGLAKIIPSGYSVEDEKGKAVGFKLKAFTIEPLGKK